jgi:hypothetical protein
VSDGSTVTIALRISKGAKMASARKRSDGAIRNVADARTGHLKCMTILAK